MRCATWMFFGHNSRAVACATARKPNLALAKAAKPDAAAQARGGASEENAAAAMRQHQARGLPPGEETGIAGHLPDLPEHSLGGVEQRKVDVRADVEDADFERRMLVGIGQKGDDFLFLARIERAAEGRAAGRFDVP